MKSIRSNGRTIQITNGDRIMFPDIDLAKSGMIEYYNRVSEHMLPYMKDRPTVLHRYPNGINGDDFYQKEEPDYFPDWIDTVDVDLKSKDGAQQLVVCNSRATLLYIANKACITPHIWLSKKDEPGHPDKLIFDLDPPANDFQIVIRAARDLKKIFDRLGLKGFVLATGSRGIHLVLPLDGSSTFEKTREIAKSIANKLAEGDPDHYTTEVRKEKRNGRLFLDYLRNAYGQTSVAPYALRARKGAPVATPLRWDELSKKDLGPRSYHYGNIFKRLAAINDPWKGYSEVKNDLSKATDKL